MNISKLKDRPHMHIVRHWDGRSGVFGWRAEARGIKMTPKLETVSQVERQLAIQFCCGLIAAEWDRNYAAQKEKDNAAAIPAGLV